MRPTDLCSKASSSLRSKGQRLASVYTRVYQTVVTGPYYGDGLAQKSLVFDIKLLEPGSQFIGLTSKLVSRRNTATKFVPIPLDGEQGWQTKQVDLVQLGTPVTLAAAEELSITSSSASIQSGTDRKYSFGRQDA